MKAFRVAHALSRAVVEVCGMFFLAAVICAVDARNGLVGLWERGSKYHARRKD